MPSSEYYRQQIEQMGEMPNYQGLIAKAYEEPVIRPIVSETAGLESQYLPTIFETFVKAGTGAGDLSPAAKLQLIGKNLGQLGSRITSNRDVQDFFKTQVQDLASLEAQRWQDKYSRLSDLYKTQLGIEEAERDRALQERLAELARRAAASSAGGGGGVDTMGALASLLTQGAQTAAQPQGILAADAIKRLKAIPRVGQGYNITLQDRINTTNQILNQLLAGESLPAEIAYRLAGISDRLNPAIQRNRYSGSSSSW